MCNDAHSATGLPTTLKERKSEEDANRRRGSVNGVVFEGRAKEERKKKKTSGPVGCKLHVTMSSPVTLTL